jgi:hypothetical protein
LGLSKTSTSIGWVLVDGQDVAGEPLDHDAFDITDASASAPAATARRVRDIATASGHTVDSVHVTTSGNVSSLRGALTEAGFTHVVSVSLADAARAWAVGQGRANGQAQTAVCILGRDSASLSVIDTASGAVQATTTTGSRDSVSLIGWLAVVFGVSPPEVLYLIGSRTQLDTVADSLANSLSIPVVATRDAQLALARGATAADVMSFHPIATDERSGSGSYAKTLAVVTAVAVVSLFTLSSAGSPVTLAERSAARPAPPQAAQPDESPPAAAAVAPMMPPPPPTAAAQPVPEELPPSSIPAAAPVAADVTSPEAIPAAVPETAEITPPVQHLPDIQQLQHMPEAQPDVAPGPAAPAPQPPPPDPLAGVLSPLFGGPP